jgi:hypothetical protein
MGYKIYKMPLGTHHGHCGRYGPRTGSTEEGQNMIRKAYLKNLKLPLQKRYTDNKGGKQELWSEEIWWTLL